MYGTYEYMELSRNIFINISILSIFIYTAGICWVCCLMQITINMFIKHYVYKIILTVKLTIYVMWEIPGHTWFNECAHDSPLMKSHKSLY